MYVCPPPDSLCRTALVWPFGGPPSRRTLGANFRFRDMKLTFYPLRAAKLQCTRKQRACASASPCFVPFLAAEGPFRWKARRSARAFPQLVRLPPCLVTATGICFHCQSMVPVMRFSWPASRHQKATRCSTAEESAPSVQPHHQQKISLQSAWRPATEAPQRLKLHHSPS